MVWNPFKTVPKKCLGIDIGTSSIRIVELSSSRRRRKLENYGELSTQAFAQKPFKILQRNSCILSNKDIALVIKNILDEAKIKTKKAVFSIPDFSSFFTWFKLPPMTKEELPQAVEYEARQHIPFPLSEVVLDWQIIKGGFSGKERKKIKILLVSVPKQVINQYREIVSLTNLELLAMEAEAFGLSRSLIKENLFNLRSKEKEIVAIVDIGSQSATVSIIDKGVLKRSHSFDIAGNALTDVLIRAFNVNYKKAEELKQKYGISGRSRTYKDIRQVLLPLIDLILTEIEKVCQSFNQTEQEEVQKIIIAGGAALIPGLDDYFAQHLKKPLEIANPFSSLFYPPILEARLKKMGPLYAVALGAGLRGIE